MVLLKIADKKQKTYWPILFIMCLAITSKAFSNELEAFNQLYQSVIEQHWHSQQTINGIRTTSFDYGAIKESDANQLEKAQSILETFSHKFRSKQEEKAFWINVYNFAAMKLVADHYPVQSIRSLKISIVKHPWSKKIVNIAGKTYSLSEIEKDILLKRFQDSRILFAVNCAAVSCPDREPKLYTPMALDQQLDNVVETFFKNNTKGLSIEGKDIYLAWILKKDRAIIESKHGSLTNFLSQYVDDGIRNTLEAANNEFNFFEHDWTLNDYRLVDKGGDNER